MRKWLSWFMFFLMSCLLFVISACSGSTTGSAVEKTIILIVVLMIVAICLLIALGIFLYKVYKHNKDKIAAVHTTVNEVQQAVATLKK